MRALVPIVTLLACGATAQNSTRKVRPEPSALAARAGTAVAWRADLDAALAESREASKPVFWYVPTVPGSPMDRKPEIDRYMRAGPFSWPSTIALLNDAFVPVSHVPSRAEQKRYGLAPGAFIEPGWVVLGADGVERARLDRITTFERRWFEVPLERLAGVGRLAEHVPTEAEREFARGAEAFRAGDRERARALWRALGEARPDDPVAWKAMAEVEGHGPFALGFEVCDELPAAVVEGARDGSRAPEGVFDEPELWRRGIAFLLAMRDENGAIVDSRYDFGGTDSLPNVWTACTAIAGWALVDHVARAAASDPDPAVVGELARFVEHAADDGRLAAADTDEIVWAHVYRLRFLARMIDHTPEASPRRARLYEVARAAVAALVALQSKEGAWFHEYRNPFVTASVLLALAEAERCGITVDQVVVERGVRALLTCRVESGAVSYGMPRRGRVRASIPAASGRMPLVELALLRQGHGGQDSLVAALEAAFEHHDELAAVRKYDDHANRHGHGGFFFWYDMRARSEAIAAVEDPELRAGFAARQREIVLALPEIDGCFVDSHELGRSYGTAMALLTLSALPRPARRAR